MARDAAGLAGPITECTLAQLLTCLGELGLSERDLARTLREVLESGHVRLVGGFHPWLSDTAAGRRSVH